MLRVATTLLGFTISLHRYAERPAGRWKDDALRYTQRLRREQIGFARAMADYTEGMLLHRLCQQGDPSVSPQHASQRLKDAIEHCRQRRLRPYYLAAEDALAEIEAGHSAGRLKKRMVEAHVACPEKLRRLYAVPDACP
jgi:hypothetical protein